MASRPSVEASVAVESATSETGRKFAAFLSQMTSPGALAYWIGILGPKAPPLASGDARGLCSTMSYQFDVEEQAHRTGHTFPHDADWRPYFEPAAPIQLTNAWSPLDASINRLGDPAMCDVAFDPDVRRLGAALVWRPNQLAAIGPTKRRGEPGDERRFAGLLEVVLMRASKRAWGVLLVVRPGWSYEWAQAPSNALRGAWRRAGFATDDRRPRPSPTTAGTER